ncbi:hypothetical protein ACIA5D_43190 [Actinoplanes sp. NPDC051513]|uniref:hypothetical protein n=1 Tax=Actinoplanes sp. NPDC051513 TaxID=3363908 RepID=UPI00379DA704
MALFDLMIGATPVVELDDVTFRRDGKEILHGVSLTVRQEERPPDLVPGKGSARCSPAATASWTTTGHLERCRTASVFP